VQGPLGIIKARIACHYTPHPKAFGFKNKTNLPDSVRLLLVEVLHGSEIFEKLDYRKYSTLFWNPADPKPILTLSPTKIQKWLSI
jgi:hypothetical protein